MYFLYSLVTFVRRVIAQFEFHLQGLEWAGTAQSVYRLATDWMVRESNVDGGEIFRAGPGAYPASYTTGTGLFLGLKRPERDVNHKPLLPPRLKKEYSIDLLPLWAFMGCYRAKGCTLYHNYHQCYNGMRLEAKVANV